MKIVFWGTPAFALPSFRALLGEGHDVVAVVTQPDRPVGRRREVRPSPVRIAADEEGIPVVQPEKASGAEFVAWLREQSADLNVVVAYGQILRKPVLESARLGSINVHASLLPLLRGAAPIQWAIARGHDRTGITIMRMDERLDAGPILLQVQEPIGADETGAELAGRLSEIGAEALVEALALLEFGELEDAPQNDADATWAPMITRDQTRVDWTGTANQVGAHIRAFDDVPGAWTMHGDAVLKLYRPAIAEAADGGAPGTVLDTTPSNAPHGLRVACGTGSIWIREVKPSGRRRMTSADWLRGRPLERGVRLQ